LRALEPPRDKQDTPENYAEYRAALEKVKQTPAYLELEKSIADKFPSNYNELDSRQDRARLRELEVESKTRPLTQPRRLNKSIYKRGVRSMRRRGRRLTATGWIFSKPCGLTYFFQRKKRNWRG
jgi:hypothetical protein